MKTSFLSIAFLAAFSTLAPAQQVSPPAAKPSAGVINDWLREQSPAFEPWDIGAEFRVRFEHKEHFAIPGVPGAIDFRKRGAPASNTYLLLREKVHIGYAPSPWITLFAQGRDSSAHWDERRPSPEHDRLDLHQAFVRLGNPKEFPLSAKVGRQELSYGDERLVGAFDWNNVGRVFDAAKLRFEREPFWVDGFIGRVVLINDRHFNVSNDYDLLSGIYSSTRTFVPKQETQLYFLARNTGAQSPRATAGSPQAGGPPARDIYTLGLRIKSLPGEFGGWDYGAELAGQFGRVKQTVGPRAGENLDHEAFAAHIAGGYTWREAFGAPRLGLEYNYASGDKDIADGKHRTFENLFPTNHRFYGYMDFVSWKNIHNARLAGSIKPHPKVTLTADYHAFWLAETSDFFYTVGGARRGGAAPTSGTGYGINPQHGSYLGSEIDFTVSWAMTRFAHLHAGYSHFFVGDYVERSLAAPAFRASDADYVYVQLRLTF